MSIWLACMHMMDSWRGIIYMVECVAKEHEYYYFTIGNNILHHKYT